MNGAEFKFLNSANIVLIPKKPDAKSVGDYRPISLIHSIAKIFSKLLANRLAPFLNNLVSKSQSAFIRKRCIQDNFLYVQNVVRRLHKQKKSALFLKLDIQKAFDSVNWGYLLEVLQDMGFGPRWREWISILFGTTSFRALFNGSQGSGILHRSGVRQGDPLSPMLFILAIDPVHRILELATRQGILSPLPLNTPNLRTSLYADDAAIFINPLGMKLWRSKTSYTPLDAPRAWLLTLKRAPSTRSGVKTSTLIMCSSRSTGLEGISPVVT
jgi:retron-type reverse transcriptase